MRILYFAWLKTRIGTAEEEVSPPSDVRDVASLVAWLKTRGPRYAEALANDRVVRVAVNRIHAKSGTAIGPGDEIALFPPVTGG